MEPGQKLAIVEDILFRAAENFGDITGPVMDNFYNRSEGGRELFRLHSRHMNHLEGLMVEQSVFCRLAVPIVGIITAGVDTLVHAVGTQTFVTLRPVPVE